MSQASVSFSTFAVPTGFQYPAGYTGSASWRLNEDSLERIIIKKPPPKAAPAEPENLPPRTLNKSKIRAKIKAFCRLQKSKKFLAFYTVTFPAHLTDDSCFKTLNVILTRIRKLYSQFDYIWVSERQRNKTIHFHLLTNNYINVRVFNHFAKKAISTQVYKNKESSISWKPQKYNGVDVRKVYNARKVGGYISKYVTKNTIVSAHAVWNCSRSISALFTSYRTEIDVEWAEKYFAQKIFEKYIEFFGDPRAGKIEVYAYIHAPPIGLLSPLDDLNEYVFSLGFPAIDAP